MMCRDEKRRYERLGVEVEISCCRIGLQISHACKGNTVNISPGGAYFRTKAETLKQGELLKIELSIPPKSGLLEFGGKMTGYANVLRTDEICDSITGDDPSKSRYGVALQFCRPLKFNI